MPQHPVLEGLDTDISESWVEFMYQFTKGGKYAYDFITSWDQAVMAADQYAGQTWGDSLIWSDLGKDLSQRIRTRTRPSTST